MKIIVIGSHGFIGSKICSKLINSGHQVFGIDDLSIYNTNKIDFYYFNQNLRQKIFLKDLKDFSRLNCNHSFEFEKIVNSFAPDIIINVAGTSIADVCKKNTQEAVESIYSLNSNILEVLKNKNIKKYIFFSSSMVYGNFSREIISEDDETNPIDPYGAIKLGCEYLIKSFNQQFNLPYVIVRPSAVYGPTDANMRVSGIFIYNSFINKPLKVMDKQERLDFTYVDDLANGIKNIVSNDVTNEIFNLTTGDSKTIYEFASIIKSIKKNVIIESNAGEVEFMEGLKRPKRGTLNISKAREILNFKPAYDLEKGVKEYLDFMEENCLSYFEKYKK